MTSESELIQKLKRYRTDPWAFCTDGVYTLDQADKIEPIKRFPSQHDYLRLYTLIWLRERLIAVPKSRRMFMSWMNIILYTWDTAFHIGRFNAFVSKKEEDANELVVRAKFVLDRIPEACIPKALMPKYEYTFGKLRFPELNSMIQGFPQGADQLRQFTFSGILADEMAFWDNAEDMYSGAFPTLEGGGRFTAISSAAPGFFKYLVHDQLHLLGGKDAGDEEIAV